MAPTSTLLRAARPAFRSSFFTAQAQTARLGRHFRFQGRRWQSTTQPIEEQQSWFKRMWDSPIGLKTVHFWAPVMKWALVLAGVSDFYRPAEKLSLTQNLALTATGLIWTRWCLIIKPRNILLATVNFFLGIVGIVQVSRITLYNMAQSKKTPAEKLEDSAVQAAEKAKEVIKS